MERSFAPRKEREKRQGEVLEEMREVERRTEQDRVGHRESLPHVTDTSRRLSSTVVREVFARCGTPSSEGSGLQGWVETGRVVTLDTSNGVKEGDTLPL